MKYGKLFWKIGEPEKHVRIIPITWPEEMFEAAKPLYNRGFRQAIVTDEAMFGCIHALEQEGYRLTNIEIEYGNGAFKDGFSKILEEYQEHLDFFVRILENLDPSCILSSTLIDSVEMTKEGGNEIAIFSNGLLRSDDEIPPIIAETVQKCIFG